VCLEVELGRNGQAKSLGLDSTQAEVDLAFELQDVVEVG
jgi:hypothetical protein